MAIDDHSEAVHGAGVGLQPSPALPRLVPLGDVSGQASLDVLETASEHGTALDQTGDP
jgi:hypothetical protein